MSLRDLSTPEGFAQARADEIAVFYEQKYGPRIQDLISQVEQLEDALADSDAEVHRLATAARVWANTLGHKFTETPQTLLSRARFFKRRNATYGGVQG